MRRHTGMLLAPLLLALVALCCPALVSAQAAQRAHRADPAGHVTILVLDMSGSMSQNDPHGLRCSAANAYIDLSGPGDYIGVVGLDGDGSGGPNGFGAAQSWAAPAEMATVSDRATLRQTIAQRSNDCKPDAYTPTYDALNQALGMLKSATAHSGLSGSVILLTDGAPAPQQDAQIAAIQQDLLPQFKQGGFPIDAIALGSDQSFHPFLSGLADATSGSFYDDGNGAVPGVSALNIAPFFLDIFARRNGRVVSHDIPPTQLNATNVSRNFSVGNFVGQLSVVAVKDSPSATVTLTAPNGQTLSSSTAGVLYAGDPHYAIFSIPNPQQGAWQVNVSGSGMFLMDSLKISTLTLNISAPDAHASAAPLGQPLTVAASLENGGTPVTGSHYSLTGTLTYAGGAGQYSQDFVLDDSASPGVFQAQVQAPASAPPGAYTVTVVAREISDTIASATRSVRIERFPTPVLLSQTTHQPVAGAVRVTVTEWDPILRAIYGAPLGLLNWLSQWPLQGIPARPGVNLPGQVMLDGKLYANATVSGTVAAAGAHSGSPLTITKQGGGAFTAYIPAASAGAYTLTLDTQGAFQDSHGDFGVTTRSATVAVTRASFGQEFFAWMITVLYALLLWLLILTVRYVFAPRPFGRLIASDGSGGAEFSRARRGLWALWRPSVVLSHEMDMEPGLAFLFRPGKRILVKGNGAGARDFRLGGDPLPSHAVSAMESPLTTHDGELSYLVSASNSDDDDAELGHGSRRGSRYRDEDDDDAPRGRSFALLGRRRASDDDEDDDRPARRSRSRRGDDDDDYRPTRSARGRARRGDDEDDRPARARSRRRRDDDDDW